MVKKYQQIMTCENKGTKHVRVNNAQKSKCTYEHETKIKKNQ